MHFLGGGVKTGCATARSSGEGLGGTGMGGGRADIYHYFLWRRFQQFSFSRLPPILRDYIGIRENCSLILWMRQLPQRVPALLLNHFGLFEVLGGRGYEDFEVGLGRLLLGVLLVWVTRILLVTLRRHLEHCLLGLAHRIEDDVIVRRCQDRLLIRVCWWRGAKQLIFRIELALSDCPVLVVRKNDILVEQIVGRSILFIQTGNVAATLLELYLLDCVIQGTRVPHALGLACDLMLFILFRDCFVSWLICLRSRCLFSIIPIVHLDCRAAL